jgi:6-phosphogluconate dehydrogenase (decarboxylating)
MVSNDFHSLASEMAFPRLVWVSLPKGPTLPIMDKVEQRNEQKLSKEMNMHMMPP